MSAHQEGIFTCGCPACAGVAQDREGPQAALGSDLTGSAAKPVWTLDQAIANLARNNYKWQAGTVLFDFDSDTTNGRSPFTDVEKQFTRAAFAIISDYIPLVFQEQAVPTVGSITFRAKDTLGEAVWGQASTSRTGSKITGSDIEIGRDAVASRAWIFGGYNFQALMHEILHALGIPHPGTYNAGGGAEITYANNATFFQDSRQYTIMSYFGPENTGASFTTTGQHGGIWSPVTPMLHDIATLQSIYGANLTTRTGNTVYGYDSNAGRDIYDFDKLAALVTTPKGEQVSPAPVMTIWDAGGVDTLNLSRAPSAVELDLREGAFSSTHGMKWNIAVAYGAKIENATGSGFGDTLIGNDLANVLQGGAGGDLLEGGTGADTLDGGVGADTLNGGQGDDTFLIDDRGDLIVEAAAGGSDTVVTGLAWFVLPAHVEALVLAGTAVEGYGNLGHNLLRGNSEANVLGGLEGDDRLEGFGGDDFLNGGPGADTMVGGGGNDTFVSDGDQDLVVEEAGGGIDTLHSHHTWAVLPVAVEVLKLIGVGDQEGYGTAVSDTIIGNEYRNVLGGLAGDDRLEGLSGDDFLNGGPGADTMIGGSGDDTFVSDGDSDVVVESAGGGVDTLLTHHTWAVLPSNVEVLRLIGGGYQEGYGSAAADTIVGNDFTNVLGGLAGDDRLEGWGGDDFLNGGPGSDTMVGGLGDDVYIVDSAGDVVVEIGGGGTDEIRSHLFQTALPSDVERLVLVGGGPQNGTGNGLANVLSGNAFANRLDGGAGADTLTGGGGADVFVFRPGSGWDVVTDFSPSEDSLDLSAYVSASIAWTTAKVGADTVLTFGNGDLVTLLGVTYAGAFNASNGDRAGDPDWLV